MNYYIDCEFDGFNGPLLSMGIVTPLGHQFYEVLKYDKINDPWVEKNVVPHLNKRPIDEDVFRAKLVDFLHNTGYDQDFMCVIADWPDDLKYFHQYLTTGPGLIDNRIKKLRIGTMLCIGVPYTSSIPHNALQDALAIMASFELT